MTYVVPNYFIEKNDSRIVDFEEIYCINYITQLSHIDSNKFMN